MGWQLLTSLTLLECQERHSPLLALEPLEPWEFGGAAQGFSPMLAMPGPERVPALGVFEHVSPCEYLHLQSGSTA